MSKCGIIFLVLQISIGSLANFSSAKSNPYLFLQIGLKESSIARSNYSSNNESLLKGILIQGVQTDCTKPKKILSSGLPLVELSGKYYYFGTYFKGNYFTATGFCREHGMNLLSIESSEENSNILNYISQYHNNIDHFWTSGTDLGIEGQFVWLATGKKYKYTYWSPPQPDNAGNIEDCMEIWKLGDKHYVWNDIPCTNEYNFICEVAECNDLCID